MRQLVVAIGVCVLGAALSAQRGSPPPAQGGGRQSGPPASQAPKFRSSVNLIHLDVSVLDQIRRPVRGLGPADFTILENGQPQTISVFTAVDIPDESPPATPWLRAVAPEVRTNDDLQERRLFLIIIDDATVEKDLFAIKNVRDIARGVVERFGPSDLASVVFTRDNRHSQDFTSDRALLLRAVDAFTIGSRGMGGPDDLWYGYSVNVIQSAVNALSALPDRRKAIIYVGQGAPVDLGVASTVVANLSIPAGAAMSAQATQGAMSRLGYQMSRAFEAAARANVNIYTIDACGLRVEMAPTCRPGLEMQYLQSLSGATGGRAFVNTNDFAPGVAAIFEENASYYLIGYESTDQKTDGKFRRLEVKVNRPGVTVRTRSGYTSDKAAKPTPATADNPAVPLGAALAGVIPKSDLPLRLHAIPFAIPGKRESAVAIILGVRQPIRETGIRTLEKVDLQVNAYNVEGKAMGSSSMRADVTVRAGATGLAEYEVISRIDLKPGRYQLRVAANVGSLSTSGSLYTDVDVPDFSGAPVSLSGLMMTATPRLPFAVREGFAPMVPVIPTAQRVFRRGDTATAVVRVFQGGKKAMVAVPITTRLRSDKDQLVMDEHLVLTPEMFTAERWADVRVTLPVGRAPAGDYLLTIETPAGKTAVSRDARFTLR